MKELKAFLYKGSLKGYDTFNSTFFFKESYDKIHELSETVREIPENSKVFFIKGTRFPRDVFKDWGEDYNISSTIKMENANVFVLDFDNIPEIPDHHWNTLSRIDLSVKPVKILLDGKEEILANKQNFYFKNNRHNDPVETEYFSEFSATCTDYSYLNQSSLNILQQLEFLCKVKDPKIITASSLFEQIDKTKRPMSRLDFDSVLGYLKADDTYHYLAYRLLTKFNLNESKFYLDILKLETGFDVNIPDSISYEELKVFCHKREKDIWNNLSYYSKEDNITQSNLEVLLHYYDYKEEISQINEELFKSLIFRSFKKSYENTLDYFDIELVNHGLRGKFKPFSIDLNNTEYG